KAAVPERAAVGVQIMAIDIEGRSRHRGLGRQRPASFVGQRRWRRLRLGLSTLFSGKPKGYFIPYRHAYAALRDFTHTPYTALEPVFEEQRESFERLLATLGPLPSNPRIARWDQDWFPPLDAAVAYSIVRMRQPGRIVEVGSGHSTRF